MSLLLDELHVTGVEDLAELKQMQCEIRAEGIDKMRWLLLALYVWVLFLWFALPWITPDGAIHSSNQLDRVASYCLWFFYGSGAARIILGGWWKDWRREIRAEGIDK